MKNRIPIILIISLILVFGIWKISWALKRRKEKEKFIEECESFQARAKFVGTPVPCEEQWEKKQAGL